MELQFMMKIESTLPKNACVRLFPNPLKGEFISFTQRNLKVHEKHDGISIFFLALLKPHANLCQQLYSCCLFSNPEQKGGDQWFLINMLTVLQNHSEKGVNRFTSPPSGEVLIFPPTSGFHPD